MKSSNQESQREKSQRGKEGDTVRKETHVVSEQVRSETRRTIVLSCTESEGTD